VSRRVNNITKKIWIRTEDVKGKKEWAVRKLARCIKLQDCC